MIFQPLFASEKRAAALLDIEPGTFRDLVGAGVLPGPMIIGDQQRWDVEALKSAIRGEPDTLDTVTW